MIKLPPKEKIVEAYTAIVDGRVEINNYSAIVNSSDFKKVYTVKWKDNIFYSNDNATYWQGYLGYPVLAVLMMNGKLSYAIEVAKYFTNVNWHELNLKYKRNYSEAVNEIINDLPLEIKNKIYKEIDKVYKEIEQLDIVLTKKKNF